MTIPQLQILGRNLEKINKAENGKDEEGKPIKSDEIEEDKYLVNRQAFGNTVRLLKERTGRKKFTQKEVLDPEGTIRKYTNANNNNIPAS